MPLGPEFRVNTYITNGQGGAALASSSTGNFVVVWVSQDQDGSLTGIFGQRHASAGAPLGGEFRVNTFTTAMQRGPSVASDSPGNFVVAWYGYAQDGSGYGVFAQRYASTGTPQGSEFRVNSYTTGAQTYPAVASDAVGNFVVAWSSYRDGFGYGVFAQRYASTGVALGGEFRVNSYTTLDQRLPSLASDSAGNFVVAWESYAQDGPGGWGVFAQRFLSTGTPLGSEFRVNSYTTGYQTNPAVASDAVGNFVVAWSSYQDGFGFGVYAQRYASTGTPLGGEFRVNSHTTLDQRSPSVASDPAGNFVVAWESFAQDGATLGVFAQRFLSTGAALGGEFRVNTYTTSYQFAPSVASDSAGNFVVAWQSDTQDGSSFGVFGQRYNMILPVELLGFRVE